MNVQSAIVHPDVQDDPDKIKINSACVDVSWQAFTIVHIPAAARKQHETSIQA